MDTLNSISSIASSGLRAQGERLRVVSENIANANSTAMQPGDEPYRRKLISFSELVDSESGASMVQVTEVSRDSGDFTLKYDPAHPAADDNGYIQLPNVNPLIEMSNMREAARSYEANMSMLENVRNMRNQLIDMLK